MLSVSQIQEYTTRYLLIPRVLHCKTSDRRFHFVLPSIVHTRGRARQHYTLELVVMADTVKPAHEALRAIVVGAGPAGCIVALALKRAGIDVSMVERDVVVAVKGGGGPIILGGVAQTACAILGVPFDKIVTSGGRPCSQLNLRYGNVTAAMDWDHWAKRGVVSPAGMRKEIAAALRSLVEQEGIRVTTGVSISSFKEESTGVTLLPTATSSTAAVEPLHADFAIACDGVNSVIRHQIMGPVAGAKQLVGFTAFGFITRVPSEEITSAQATALRDVRDGTTATYYYTPCSSGCAVLLVPYDATHVAMYFFCKDAAPSVAAALTAANAKALKGATPSQQKVIMHALLSEFAFSAYPELVAAWEGLDVSDEAAYPSITARIAALPKPQLISSGGKVLLVGDSGWPM